MKFPFDVRKPKIYTFIFFQSGDPKHPSSIKLRGFSSQRRFLPIIPPERNLSDQLESGITFLETSLFPMMQFNEQGNSISNEKTDLKLSFS